MKRVQLYLSKRDLEICELLKKEFGESRSAIIRRALEQYYNKNKDKK